MKRLLKYLFPVIAAVAFWNFTEIPVSRVAEGTDAAMSLIDATCQTSVSEPQAELCLPYKVSFANSCRVQVSARRTFGSSRTNIGFMKSGRIVNAGIRYFVQKKSIIIHSSLIEPGHRLLCLGKLII